MFDRRRSSTSDHCREEAELVGGQQSEAYPRESREQAFVLLIAPILPAVVFRPVMENAL